MAADLDRANTAANTTARTAGRWDDLGLPLDVGADIASAAARVGHHVWLSARLFEITGGWATHAQHPALVIGFASVSTRFAWQAAEWRRRLPRLREVDQQTLIRQPSARSAVVLDDLAATAPSERLAALELLVPMLHGYYGSISADASPLRDGPVLRTLERIRSDLTRMADEIGDIRHVMGRTDLRFPDP